MVHAHHTQRQASTDTHKSTHARTHQQRTWIIAMLMVLEVDHSERRKPVQRHTTS